MTRTTSLSSVPNRASRSLVAIVCAALLAPGETVFLAQAAPATAPAAQAAAAEEPKLPPEQLDALVAPIALYPDPLLGQVLVASTYPLEIVQLQQWLAKNQGLKDKALADAVAKQPWDPSIQSMAALPDVVKRLGDDIQWTTDLGNAFLAQQSDVMDAVQRMRKKAEGTGALKTTEQQKVETKVVEQKTVIVVEQANPQVVYVPSYNPVVVYGPPVYAYPPIYYPPCSTGAVVAAGVISFGVGMAIGAAWGRRLGLRLRLGPQRHQRQHQQQLQPEHQHQSQHQRQSRREHELESQSSAPRRRSVFEPDDRQQVRRDGPRGPRAARRARAAASRGRRRRSRDPVGGGRLSSRRVRPVRGPERQPVGGQPEQPWRRSRRRRRSGRKPGRRSEQELGRLQRLRQLRRLQRRERPGQQRERVFERGIAGRQSFGGRRRTPAVDDDEQEQRHEIRPSTFRTASVRSTCSAPPRARTR